ncbi:MAG: aldehyde dehydrogenase family protein [Bacteroidota bacterium]|nr:aldehyde dehydrogenase family protein [Bacteroidota bacterium]
MIQTVSHTSETVIECFLHLKKQVIINPNPDYEERISSLKKLEKNLLLYQTNIQIALRKDFNKPEFETDVTETYTILMEIRYAIKNLKNWMRRTNVATPIILTGTNSYIEACPKGIVLIIAPWNYPVNLSLGPLVSAIAAGNKIIIKPSEFSPYSSALIQEICETSFTKDQVQVIRGDANTSIELCRLAFNHIYFTGSSQTGKHVLKAAAENLCPVTLELGGKCPVIIDSTANVDLAAESIALAKGLNAGQTCIAPDYAVIHESIKHIFIGKLNDWFEKLYGPNFLKNEDYCGIIHANHFDRIVSLAESSLTQNAMAYKPFQYDRGNLKIAPLILTDIDWSHKIMQEEIFGPVIPIISYKNISDITTKLSTLPRPLCQYIFSKDANFISQIMNNCASGGTTINQCLLNYCNIRLPFGGSMESGMGSGHGKYGFETFSHFKGISIQSKWPSTLRFFAPPYTTFKKRLKNYIIKNV